jgi:NAD(P)-dependent dehydrogenase (short-subunit alcohol dehydrogenase family)
MDLDVRDKVYVITGGTDGIGAATALALAAEGARVAVCSRNAERVAAMGERLAAVGGDHLSRQADVTDIDDLRRLFSEVEERWDRLDGLMNNAGATAGKPFQQINDSEWQRDLDLKFFAARDCVNLALPMLRESKGSIVNVLSIFAKAPNGASMPSSVSRAAGLAFTKALSHDLATEGIRVNALLVGFVLSDQWNRAADGAGVPVESWIAETVDRLGVPLGRVGRSEEFADVATFLLSPRASYLTGTSINVDGGLSPVI